MVLASLISLGFFGLCCAEEFEMYSCEKVKVTDKDVEEISTYIRFLDKDKVKLTVEGEVDGEDVFGEDAFSKDFSLGDVFLGTLYEYSKCVYGGDKQEVRGGSGGSVKLGSDCWVFVRPEDGTSTVGVDKFADVSRHYFSCTKV
jgi:hypothetical protein